MFLFGSTWVGYRTLRAACAALSTERGFRRGRRRRCRAGPVPLTRASQGSGLEVAVFLQTGSVPSERTSQGSRRKLPCCSNGSMRSEEKHLVGLCSESCRRVQHHACNLNGERPEGSGLGASQSLFSLFPPLSPPSSLLPLPSLLPSCPPPSILPLPLLPQQALHWGRGHRRPTSRTGRRGPWRGKDLYFRWFELRGGTPSSMGIFPESLTRIDLIG